MLITPMICLTIINLVKAGSGIYEAGSHYLVDDH